MQSSFNIFAIFPHAKANATPNQACDFIAISLKISNAAFYQPSYKVKYICNIHLWLYIFSLIFSWLILRIHFYSYYLFLGETLILWMSLGEWQGCMFAPALFCIAIDLILELMSRNHDASIWPAHCNQTQSTPTTLPLPLVGRAAELLLDFSTATAPLEPKASWKKPHLQNPRPSRKPAPLNIGKDAVESSSNRKIATVKPECHSNRVGTTKEDIYFKKQKPVQITRHNVCIKAKSNIIN